MPASKSAFQEALKKASNAAWDQRWDTAIKEYRRALAEYSDDASAHSGLALALQESNKLEDALAEYQVLAKMHKGDPVPLARIAHLLERVNRKSDALATYLQLAELYQTQKQMNKAVEAWRKASALDPDRIEPHEKLAQAFSDAGHNGPAAREYFALAKLNQRSGDATRAQEYIERALALEPENTQAKFLLNDLTGQGGSMAGQPGANPVELARRTALSRLAASVLDDKTPWRRGDSGGRVGADVDGLLIRAIDAQANGQARDAIQLYEQILSAGVSRPEVQFNLAILYQSNLRHNDAIALLKQTVQVPQFAIASHFAMGQSYRVQGKVDDALDHYIQAMKIVDLSTVNRAQADQVIRLYESLTESYHAKGDDASANQFSSTLIDFLSKKGWQDKVREVRDHIAMAGVAGTPLSMQEVFETPEAQRVIELLKASDELLRARKLYAAGDLAYQAIELAPNYLPSHVQLAEIAVASGHTTDAVAKYDTLGETALVRNDLPKAVSFYRQALKLAPEDVKLRSKLINVLTQSGQLTEALGEFEGVGMGLEAAGEIQKAADKYEEGLGLAVRAGVVGDTVMQLRHRLADAFMKLGEWDKALAICQEIRQTEPNSDHVQYQLVELYMRLGQTRDAETELNQLLERYAERPQAARAILTQLAETFPDSILMHHQLAKTYAALGDTQRAVEALDAVGERLLNAGNSADAIAVIHEIIALNPPQVDDYRRLLLELREPHIENVS